MESYIAETDERLAAAQKRIAELEEINALQEKVIAVLEEHMQVQKEHIAAISSDILPRIQGVQEAAKKRIADLEAVSTQWENLANIHGRRMLATEERVKELEQLAQQGEWEPVPDGSLALLLQGLERYQRQIGRAELQGWYETDVARNEIARIDEMLQALRGNEDTPPTLVLCRRKEQPHE